MATMTKTNGIAKRGTTSTVKKEMQKKLAQEATGKTPKASAKEKPEVKLEKPIINLDERMQKFEQLKGLASQRERLSDTLTELTKFKYNQSDSATFYLRDSNQLEFKTTNTNLIHLITNHLKMTLDTRKNEIEKQLIAFEL